MQQQQQLINLDDLLTWQRVHDWAASKEPLTQIGLPKCAGECPFAHYLQEMTGNALSCLYIAEKEFYYIQGDNSNSMKTQENPNWMRETIYAVDRYHQPITARQFLRHLKKHQPQEVETGGTAV